MENKNQECGVSIRLTKETFKTLKARAAKEKRKISPMARILIENGLELNETTC